MLDVNKRAWHSYAYLIGLVFVLMNLQDLNRPYVIDEAAFPYGAQSILEQGDPYFYNGETRPRDLALWHPPLYIFSLALHMVFWGTSNASVRIFGILCALATVLIASAIFRNTLERQSAQTMATVLFSGIYLFNPLLSESALVPDIDGTIALPILAYGLLLCTYVYKQPWSKILILMTVIFWSLLFATKFTIAILFIPVFLLFVALQPGKRMKNVIVALGSLLAGFLGFILWWKVVSALTSSPFSAPFSYFSSTLASKSGLSSSLRQNLLLALDVDARILFWLGMPLILAFFLCMLWLALTSIRHRKIDAHFVFGFFGIYSFFAYNVITGVVFTFPKYWVVCALPMCLVVSYAATKLLWKDLVHLEKIESQKLLIPGFIVIATGIGISYVFARRADSNYGGSINTLIISTAAMVTFLLISVALCQRVLKIFDGKAKRVLSALVITSMTLSVFLLQLGSFAQHRNSEYSTSYYFGEVGLREVIVELRDNMNDKQILLAPKDVGIQSGIPFIEDAFIASLSEDEVRSYLLQNRPEVIVTRKKFDYSEPVYPQYFDAVRSLYAPKNESAWEDFTIWYPIFWN
jgi:4-amino-4-deoxy-L-arabinose transferase-like glycosyltransferase